VAEGTQRLPRPLGAAGKPASIMEMAIYDEMVDEGDILEDEAKLSADTHNARSVRENEFVSTELADTDAEVRTFRRAS
jgi:hypothetical protein